MDKINITNLFRTLSSISFAVTIYGLIQNKSIDELVDKIEKEQIKNKLINEKYKKFTFK
jgi:hypothetical protein